MTMSHNADTATVPSYRKKWFRAHYALITGTGAARIRRRFDVTVEAEKKRKVDAIARPLVVQGLRKEPEYVNYDKAFFDRYVAQSLILSSVEAI